MKQFKDYTQMRESSRLQTNVDIMMQSNHWDYETKWFFLTKYDMVIPECDSICRITGMTKKCRGL